MIATLVLLVLWALSILAMVYRIGSHAMKLKTISLEDAVLGVFLIATAPIIWAVWLVGNADDIILWGRKS